MWNRRKTKSQHHGRAADFFGGVAGKPTASITDEPQTSLAVWPENKQPEHYCLIKDVGLYRHHGRAAAFLAINIK
ncbi:hypothetical protein TNCV_4438631 [Trichonephila clavipes]|nr:hypothetical protein TNCV_4438611 [Trichonephila clavipes]GFX02880.1 hypothetical protein TNCV_4438621 [Trichonephila clavipes]GFX02881.1 hypothetical protein TNCV_4438631 [Trichonephila clavipes]